MNYEILSDVSLDIDHSFADDHGVKYLPMDYTIGGDVHHCDSPVTAEEMHLYYDRLRNKELTSTSQINPFQYEEYFAPYAEAGTPVLYLCLSSGLSKTYESALMAVRNLKERFPDVQIEVVDSLGATGGQGLLTESACKNREAGMSLAENAAWLREHNNHVNYYFEVADLMYLKRGGRVSAATAVVGTALNIKPVLTILGDGTLDTVAKKRGKGLAFQYLVEQFERDFNPAIDPTVYISCADCPADAELVKEMVLKTHPEAVVRITSLSPIIGAHTGPDMLALIYYGKPRT